MEKIILEILPRGHAQPLYYKFEKGPVSVGRSYDNDVIVHDPFVSQQHAVLNFDQTGWSIMDINAVNGLLVNKKKVTTSILASGDEIFLGQTRIRFYTPDHPVAIAKVYRPDEGMYLWFEKPWASWLMLALMLALFWGQLFLHTDHDMDRPAIFISLIVFLILTLIWTGIWALVGRISKHGNFFGANLALSCSGLIVSLLTGVIALWLGFIFNATALMICLWIAVNCILGFFMLNAHQTITTHLPIRKRLLFSGIASMIVCVLIMVMVFISKDLFTPFPRVESNSKPYCLILAPKLTADQLIEEAKPLFDQAVKKAKKSKISLKPPS